jgi:replicative DNA helicase
VSEIDFDYFEKVLVKNAITNGAYLASIADYVQPKYFTDKNISKYFEIVAEFYDKRQSLPTLSEVKTYLTTDELKSNFKKLIESFKEIDSNHNEDELYENTERFLKERGMYHSILESAEEISEGEADTAKIVEKFEKIAGINLNLDKGIELYGDVEKVIDDILSDETMISSKWPWLDEALGGGFQEAGKSLYVFAGQSNIGKSIFLGNVAANIASQGKNVLVVTLEMSETLYIKESVDAFCDPENIKILVRNAATQALGDAIKAEVKDFFWKGEGRKAVAEAVRTSILNKETYTPLDDV